MTTPKLKTDQGNGARTEHGPWTDSANLRPMTEGLLFLKPLHLNRNGTCTDWDVREGKPNGRTVGRIYQNISAGGQWFWRLNDRYPSPPSHRGCAPTRAKAMLALKHRWRERWPLKVGEDASRDRLAFFRTSRR